MRKKLRVGILFGGQSAEHEVALQSAKNVVEAIYKKKYDIALIGIDKKGQWHLGNSSRFLLNDSNPKLIKLNTTNNNLTLLPYQSDKQLISIHDDNKETIDVIFPILHGTYGEDGTMQGLLKLANIPFVGASVLGSAVGMDKDVMKRLLRDAGLPVAKFLVAKKIGTKIVILGSEATPESPNVKRSWTSQDDVSFDKVVKQLGLPFFVKPANMGSSVGVSKIKNKQDFKTAINTAFSYDNKILIEEYIEGREIECSVLGNENPIASLPGEIIPSHEFYDYDAKYIDENGAAFEIPAKLPQKTIKDVQALALKTFQTLCCEGMARVDFFLDKKNELFVNEINTIPGFTKISMYPKLWEASGIPYPTLIDRLIQLAIERHRRDKKLKTSYTTR